MNGGREAEIWISFSKFQDLGIARVVERDYRETAMQEAVKLRQKKLGGKKLALYVEAFLHGRWEIPFLVVVMSGP